VSDKHFASVRLLLGFEGSDGSTTFVDDGATGHTVTASGNAQIDTAQLKFGASSGLFDGNGDFLTVSDHADWVLGNLPFTIEGFVRFAGLNTGSAAAASWPSTPIAATSGPGASTTTTMAAIITWRSSEARTA
jgi:hypothetical protein